MLKLALGIGGDVTQFSGAAEGGGSRRRGGRSLRRGAIDVEIRDDAPRAVTSSPACTNDQAHAEIADLEEVVWIEPVGEDTGDNTEASHTIQTATLDGHLIWDRGHPRGGSGDRRARPRPAGSGAIASSPAPPRTPRGLAPQAAGRPQRVLPAPLQGHSTFVAAIAAGDDRNPPGSSPPWRRLAARLVCGNRLDLNPPVANTLFSLTLAGGAGAFVHSNSWHRNTNQPRCWREARCRCTACSTPRSTTSPSTTRTTRARRATTPRSSTAGDREERAVRRGGPADPNEMNLGDGNPGPTADGRRKPDPWRSAAGSNPPW